MNRIDMNSAPAASFENTLQNEYMSSITCSMTKLIILDLSLLLCIIDILCIHAFTYNILRSIVNADVYSSDVFAD